MDSAGAIAEFAARWSLDAQATEFLASLEVTVLQSVLLEFAPRENTKDVSGKLYAFAKSISNRQVAQSQLGPDLDAFAVKWSVDAAGVAWLTSLPIEVSSILVQQFDPKEDTQNVMAKMRGFARSIQARFPSSTPGAAAVGPHGPHAVGAQVVGVQAVGPQEAATASMTEYVDEQRLTEFIMHWGIEERAQSLLWSLPPDVQATVVLQFDPKGDTKNVTGKLLGFARSVAASRQHLQNQQILDSFAMHWGLDEGTHHFLRSLPEEVKAKVIQEFDPAAGTRDVNGKLRMFAKGILSGPQQQGAARRNSGEAQMAPAHFASGTAVGADDLGGADGNATLSAEASQAVATFVARWGLDEGSASFLASLPEEVRSTVLQEFEPRENTRNIGAKLHAFANTILNGKGRGKSSASTANWEASRGAAQVHAQSDPAMWNETSSGLGQETAPWREASADLGPEETAFLERWGLSSNPQATDVLNRLQPQVRARVMQEFAPGQETKDLFGKFCGFAGSVARAAAKEGQMQRQQPPWAAAQPSYGYQPAGMGGVPEHRGWGKGGFVQEPWAGKGGKGGGLTADQFADKWQLDAGSRALLRGLSPDIQAVVMADFQPRGGTMDMSGKFCAFARSVAGKSGSQGQKRAPPLMAPWAGGTPPATRRRF